MGTWDKNNEFMMSIHGTKDDGSIRTCLGCGKEPDAIWAGKEVMTICRDCAISILPVLMADAICPQAMAVQGVKTMEILKAHWGRAESYYWRAATNNLAFKGVPIRRTINEEDEEDEAEEEDDPTSLFDEDGLPT